MVCVNFLSAFCIVLAAWSLLMVFVASGGDFYFWRSLRNDSALMPESHALAQAASPAARAHETLGPRKASILPWERTEARSEIKRPPMSVPTEIAQERLWGQCRWAL